MVSNFYVEFGQDRDGNLSLQRVPVIYGDQSRQAAQILRGNSENALPSVPAMAVYVSGLDYDRERVQEPSHVSKISLRQQRYDPDTGNYDPTRSDSFTVERIMPVPYRLTLKLDIWTSNTEQKLQLIEQIATLFNPALEIQSTDNYIDWTSLSAVFLTGTNWDSRVVPMGNDEPISISTLTFELPIWISAPAKVQKLGVVYKIINSIYDADGNIAKTVFDDESYLSRRVIAPFGFKVVYIGDKVTLVKNSTVVNGEEHPEVATSWKTLIDYYGELKDGLSELRLRHFDSNFELIGHVSYNPLDESQLIFNLDPDSAPVNTLTNVHAIIDPYTINLDKPIGRRPQYANPPGEPEHPLYRIFVTAPEIGDRFLILNPIGSLDNTQAAEVWADPNFVAEANDIIEWNGSTWRVVFHSQRESNTQYVTNLNTGVQYRWYQGSWAKSTEGIYQEGEWSIVI
jgi:hypothetical protein